MPEFNKLIKFYTGELEEKEDKKISKTDYEEKKRQIMEAKAKGEERAEKLKQRG